ncbi:hypothetical protein [Streptomyces sp. NPDC007346]|uniref:hypothetical protein n=1 Tax=Streptomyces sp. NPDC007346 TaxID=3154682 RepID=UPI003453925C
MEADADAEAGTGAAQDRAGTPPAYAADPELLRARVAAARRALDDLERALAAAPDAVLPDQPAGDLRTGVSGSRLHP